MVEEIERLTEALDAVLAREPHALADGESILALHRQHERLGAALARCTAAFERSRDWEADGARTAAAWLRTKTGAPHATAARRLRLGRDLRDMPMVEQAWIEGDLTDAHISLLAEARGVNPEAFARDEGLLTDQARTMRFADWSRALAYWRQLADQDGEDDKATKQAEGRHFHLSQTFEGTWRADGWLDALTGTIVANELQRLEKQLFEEDWRKARLQKGDAVTAADLDRTAAQRRADALVEMATRSRAMPAGARRPEPLFTVLVGYETFAGRICELANGAVVSPGALVAYLNEGWIERVVFGPASRVLDVGVRRRLFGGATRRAIEVRDRECFHEFCDVGSNTCQADHEHRYADGGMTVQDNGRLACGFHNRQRERTA